MIKHIVILKLKEELSAKQKKEAISEISNSLKILPNFIPEIKYYEIITNQSNKEGGMDLALISKFETFEDLNIYRAHPKHIEALEVIKKHKNYSTFIDNVEPDSVFEK